MKPLTPKLEEALLRLRPHGATHFEEIYWSGFNALPALIRRGLIVRTVTEDTFKTRCVQFHLTPDGKVARKELQDE